MGQYQNAELDGDTMLYYEASCRVPREVAEARETDAEEFYAGIKAGTEKYLRRRGKERAFIYRLKEDRAHVAVAAEDSRAARQCAEGLLAHLGLACRQAAELEEITTQSFCRLAQRADDRWIQDDRDYIPDYYDRHSYVRGFFEHVLEDRPSPKTLRARAGRLLMNDLAAELDRMAQGARAPAGAAKGHPVHYCLSVNDAEARDSAVRLLLTGLWGAGRLPGRRYVEMELDDFHDVNRKDMQRAFQTAEDTALVVLCGQEYSTGEYAAASDEALLNLCEYAAQYRQSVLLVLCLKKEHDDTRRWLMEEMQDAVFVTLREDNVDAEAAKKWLRARARGLGTTKTAGLTRHIRADKTYGISDLMPMVNRWRGEYLRTQVYPQYAGLNPAIRREKPKGSAYEALEEMVGIAQAKALLAKALDQHKMRRAYARCGVRQAAPAMHMVFSGSPGTAKTTVARLFAQILKDNGLLATGALHEVGRADLVGQYVGHTAPLVKKWFRKAKGSVLFIDEAYALLDGREGLYGDEAINTIVQEMERLREDVVVIFAGYPGPMKDFMARNPGLRSRIAFQVDFPDYTPEELYAILQLMVKKQRMWLEEGAGEKVRGILAAAAARPDFGNGRYARSLVERARMNQACRLAAAGEEPDAEQLTTLTAADFEAEEMLAEEKRAIGF